MNFRFVGLTRRAGLCYNKEKARTRRVIRRNRICRDPEEVAAEAASEEAATAVALAAVAEVASVAAVTEAASEEDPVRTAALEARTITIPIITIILTAGVGAGAGVVGITAEAVALAF